MKPFSACILVALLGYYQCEAASTEFTKWNEFKSKHGKQHVGDEDKTRITRFLERDAEIAEHNAKYARGEVSYSIGHTQYSDLTEEEIDRFAFGLNTPMNFSSSSLPHLDTMPSVGNVPSEWDWRTKGIQPGVRDQGQCGSCYAFAATCLIEACQRMWGRQSIDVSEQDAVDCSIRKYHDNVAGWQNAGCEGGWPTHTLHHYITTGIIRETTYPYKSGRDNKPNPQCYFNGGEYAFNARIQHMRGTETQLQGLVSSKGFVVIGIAADNEHKANFIGLKDGIYEKAGSEKLNPNHALCVVGYGVENRIPYWILQNSWGTNWGKAGYGRIRRGVNTCNILSGGFWYLEQA